MNWWDDKELLKIAELAKAVREIVNSDLPYIKKEGFLAELFVDYCGEKLSTDADASKFISFIWNYENINPVKESK